MTEEQLNEFFERQGIQATIGHYEAKQRTIYYVSIGEDHLPALLFIHGAPASLTIYKKFFTDQKLIRCFSIYAVDRPGYGLTNGRAEPSVGRQAEMIYPLAERIHRVHQPLIIVAGSYGATVACRLVMDHPHMVQALVLIAPSLGPGLEKMFGLSALLQKKFFQQFLPRSYRSASIEKERHTKELEKMLPHWKKIHLPLAYLQSKKDPVVSPRNAAFAKQYLAHVPHLDIQLFKGRKHDIISSKTVEIRDKIFEIYHLLLPQSSPA